MWLTRAILILALTVALLDVVERFQIGELFGLLVVAGLYGLLNGALIARSAFVNLPASLVTRALGVQTLAAIMGLLWLSWMLDGRGFLPTRGVVLAAVGLLSGIWLRWYPLLPANAFPVPPLSAALLMLILSLAILGLLIQLARWLPPEPEWSFRLGWGGWTLVIAGLMLAFWSAARAGAIDAADGALLGALLGYLVMLLFFLRGRTRQPFFRRVVPPGPVSLPVYLLYGALVILPAAVGYSLPGDGPEGLPLVAMTACITIFGVTWLPGISLGIGLRAYIQLFRQGG